MQMIPAFYFDDVLLEKLGDDYAEEFQNAKPFPHIIIDNLIQEDLLNIIVEEFPKPYADGWLLWGPGPIEVRHETIVNQKLGLSDDRHFGPFTRHFIAQFYSATFLRFLEKLTGIEYILPEPTYNGCGLHSTGPGGRLLVHTDTNRHPNENKMHQIMNLILFVNPDWQEEYGGHLEFWNHDGTVCEKKILPILNRLVIFETGTDTFHGHPRPLTCPPDRRRNSLALYYYILERPHTEGYDANQHFVHWRVPTS